MASEVHISIITALGSFAVSLVCIVLGYLLIVGGSTGKFELTFTAGPVQMNLCAYLPGLAFAGFGAFVAISAIRALMGVSQRRG